MKKTIVMFVTATVILTMISGCGKKEEKATDLYKGENIDEIISKAYSYFNSYVDSALITETDIYTGNTEVDVQSESSKIIYSFENQSEKDFVIRRDTTSRYNEEIISTYEDKTGYYINLKENTSEETGYTKTDKLYLTNNEQNRETDYDIRNNSYLEEAQDFYSDAEKKKKINEDGSIDIHIKANIERLNNEAKGNYDYEFSQERLNEINESFNNFIEKEELIQKELSERGKNVEYYPGEYSVKIHINAEGIITEMIENKDIDSYLNYVNGIDGRYNRIRKCVITKINENKVIKKDVNLINNKKLKGKDNFTKRLSVEDTEVLQDGEVINQLPDLETLVKRDLYYKLNKETGVITLFPLKVAYLSWRDDWDFNDFRSGSLTKEDKKLIKILEAMPTFQEAKANHTLNGRIEYLGQEQWSY